MLAASCAVPLAEPATTLPSSPTPAGLSPFFDGETATLTIDGRRLLVAVADDPEERSQGLSGVPDTAGLDGMLFIFEEPRILQFNMGDMRFPLDLWFIDDSGTIVGTETMVPCPSEPCPLYPSEDEVSRALETPQDMFDFAVGDQVIFD